MKKLFRKGMLGKIATMAGTVVLMGLPTFAAGSQAFNLTMPKAVQDLLFFMFSALIWIGAAVVIFGATQMGFAFKSDDADGKAKGMRSMIAGAIVVAVGLGAQAFFNSIVQGQLTVSN